jgi:hypothetical protein
VENALSTSKWRAHYPRVPWAPRTTPHSEDEFVAGGTALFSQPYDIASIRASLLNEGACPRTGARLLSKKTVDEMFSNQIAHLDLSAMKTGTSTELGSRRHLNPGVKFLDTMVGV